MVVGRVVYSQRLLRDLSASTETDIQGGRPTDSDAWSSSFEAWAGYHSTMAAGSSEKRFPPRTSSCRVTRASGRSTEDPLHIVRMYLQTVDEAMKRGDYDRIILVCYSMGALIGRKMLVCAYTGLLGGWADVNR